MQATIVVKDEEAQELEIQGLELRSIGGTPTSSTRCGLTAKVVWERNFDMFLGPGEEDVYSLALCFMKDALNKISTQEADQLQGHRREFYR